VKLVLIDRDGVINHEIEGYVTSKEALQLLPASLEGLAMLHQAGFTCVVITNQSVVGRGMITAQQLDEIHEYMRQEVAKHGGRITQVIACTDHPASATHRRKPNPGMLQEALETYHANPQDTIFIGDSLSDMQAAFAAGCKRYLVLTGKGKKTALHLPKTLQPVHIYENLLEAARMIINDSTKLPHQDRG